ncbi:ATP-binding protein [Streptomyces sp. SID3343]|uniref:ATP-binding protein n=1 Tax=Streptomyces sp. SID3343 TaxID=2690260 RepID=UPI001369FB57|nr:ATP-binding protein [Streptomyces sp. SID3343]MYW06537.1 hypothetical protein [Streptomyces sp. SID3343]
MTSLPAPHLHLCRQSVVTATARAHISDVCVALGVDSTNKSHADWLDDVLVAASELVTNALTHTTGEIAMHWWIEGRMLTLAVVDTHFVELVWVRGEGAVPVDNENGRGLGIVAGLADTLTYGPMGADGRDGKWVAAGFTLPDTLLRSQNRRRAERNRPVWGRKRQTSAHKGSSS